MNARRQLARLYGDRHGYEDLPTEERAVRDAGSDAMYGELMPSATERLFAYLELSKRDVFYDLGSGIGKVVLHAALALPLRRAVGIEMVRRRHDLAVEVLDQIDARGLLQTETCELWCGDFMRLPISDATVIYTCSTAFPDALMSRLARRVARLPKLRCFVSLREPEVLHGLELVDVLNLDASWRRNSKAFVYQPRKKR